MKHCRRYLDFWPMVVSTPSFSVRPATFREALHYAREVRAQMEHAKRMLA